MKIVLQWMEETAVPEKEPDEGWGQWIVNLNVEGPLPELRDEFHHLLIDLDGLIEEEQPLARFLAQIEPLGRDLAQAQSEGVRLMTMGAAKGLTVRATIVAGIEDGLVPRPNSDLSEERRILYVAMTRAKEYTFCTWARRRRGPTARAGQASTDRRRISHFLESGPVDSEDGCEYLSERFSSSLGSGQ